MQRRFPQIVLALVMMLFGVFSANTVYADKPSWAGERDDKQEKKREKEYKENKHERKDERRDGDRGDRGSRGDDRRPVAGYFNEQHRVIAREYYVEQFRSGRCPPGLAKRRDGCVAPGHAQKWIVGRPIPRDVVYYTIPQPVVVSLGVPPAGHRYVRVASDILLIAIGTGIVVDAIHDLQH